MHHACH